MQLTYQTAPLGMAVPKRCLISWFMPIREPHCCRVLCWPMNATSSSGKIKVGWRKGGQSSLQHGLKILCRPVPLFTPLASTRTFHCPSHNVLGSCWMWGEWVGRAFQRMKRRPSNRGGEARPFESEEHRTASEFAWPKAGYACRFKDCLRTGGRGL